MKQRWLCNPVTDQSEVIKVKGWDGMGHHRKKANAAFSAMSFQVLFALSSLHLKDWLYSKYTWTMSAWIFLSIFFVGDTRMSLQVNINDLKHCKYIFYIVWSALRLISNTQNYVQKHYQVFRVRVSWLKPAVCSAQSFLPKVEDFDYVLSQMNVY